MNNQTNWNTLKENGYIVLPILDQKKLKYYMEKMQNDLLAMPEFKTGYCTGYVMGVCMWLTWWWRGVTSF